MSLTLASPLREIAGISTQRVTLLERFGLGTVEDLLTHYPRRYEDRTRFDHFPQEESDKQVCVCGTVVKTSAKRLPGWKLMFEATLEDSESRALHEPIVCRWFNAHFVQKMIATGQRLVVFGKPKLRGKKICIDHPEFEIVENDDEISIHLNRITPIYRATEGLSQRALRETIFRVIEQMREVELPSQLPANLDSMPLGEALREIHFPENEAQLAAAKRHLVLAEFFAMQLFIGAKRVAQISKPGAVHCGSGKFFGEFLKKLPFPLTNAQHRVIDEIRADLASPRPMNRLLHGDVGSGKTVVALAAMLLAVEAGYECALMAPTQILAEQHYLTFRKLLDPLGLNVALRTAARSEESGPLPLFANAQTTSDEDAAAPGSARLQRAGDGVSPSRTFSEGTAYSKRRLPHFERPWAIYAVTITTHERRALSPAARTIVLGAWRHFHRQRYDLIALCAMPDHVHVLLQPLPKQETETGEQAFWKLGDILRSIKSFTAREINRLENRTGSLWERESFDRHVRSDGDLEEKFNYILRNPWDAKIVAQGVDYPWVWTPEDEFRETTVGRSAESSSRQNAETSTLQACAPRNSAQPSGEDAVAWFAKTSPQILIGTHALLYEQNTDFKNLGLVVIDEQHKFGVMQRGRLIAQGATPDVLVMTATPIPRTLTMTVYGDLDVSTLDEMPANRGRIVTALRDGSKLPDAVKFVREQLEAGRQAYIVYPLIDESAKLEAKAAAAEFEKWKTLLAPMPCALLHGRIEAAEKEAIMEKFRRGETKALIATSVIEVGIDVPNANIMLIENAERFGLAQLHQLRGRIGRGAHKSYCILLSDAKNAEAVEKLRALEETADGFAIAETDLRLRGPGDILGTAQSGLPPLKLGDLLADQELMRLARQAATELFASDPELSRAENQRFRELIVERKKLMLAQIS